LELGRGRLTQDRSAIHLSSKYPPFAGSTCDPNVVLQKEIASQNMQSFVTLIVTTDAAGKLPTPPPNPTNPPAPESERPRLQDDGSLLD
jgi:hypothetical protein